MKTILNTSPALRLLANSIEGLRLLADVLFECGAPVSIQEDIQRAILSSRSAYKSILDAATELTENAS